MRTRTNHPAEIASGELLACQDAIGYIFRRIGLLRKALTHSSVKDDRHPSNERLEFLGDAVLGMVISEYLFSMLPENDEGDLTKVKSVVVSGEVLSRLGLEMGVDRFLVLGKGLRLKREIPRSLVANAVEAIIAAVYLDRGVDTARHFVLDHLHRFVVEVLNDEHADKNFKSMLQQRAQRVLGHTPTYRILGEGGTEHSKVFRVTASIGGHEFPVGKGASKKDAEQDAARRALKTLESRSPPPRRGSRRRGGRKASGRGAAGKPEKPEAPAPKAALSRGARSGARKAKKSETSAPERATKRKKVRSTDDPPAKRAKKSETPAPRSPPKRKARKPAASTSTSRKSATKKPKEPKAKAPESAPSRAGRPAEKPKKGQRAGKGQKEQKAEKAEKGQKEPKRRKSREPAEKPKKGQRAGKGQKEQKAEKAEKGQKEPKRRKSREPAEAPAARPAKRRASRRGRRRKVRAQTSGDR